MSIPLYKLSASSLLLALLVTESLGQETHEHREHNCSFDGFCQWWSGSPGELYRNKRNPWIQQIEINGRFHYQFGRVQGEDVRGNSFSQNFDEFRRARVSAEIDFLKFFEIEVGANFVDDNRFQAEAPNGLDWGFDSFDSAVISFDLGKAFGSGPFDDIELKFGRMKLDISEEVQTSSNDLLVIERSAITDRLGGDDSRPTGATIEFEKNDWTLILGVFSNEADARFLSDWGDGIFYYGSLEWQPNDSWTLRADHVYAQDRRIDSALGYRHGTAVSVIYESNYWGFSSDFIYGQNALDDERDPLREGNFYGGQITPWVWLLRDRVRLVARYQYARAEETEGIRLSNRYVRAQHFPPETDLDNGFGDENHSFYLGLNWRLCDRNIRLLSGVSHDLLSARTGDVSATTYLFAVRTSF